MRHLTAAYVPARIQLSHKQRVLHQTVCIFIREQCLQPFCRLLAVLQTTQPQPKNKHAPSQAVHQQALHLYMAHLSKQSSKATHL